MFEDKLSNAQGQTPRQVEPTDNSLVSFSVVSDDVKNSPLQSNRIKDEVDNSDRPGSKRRYVSSLAIFLCTYRSLS